MDCYPDAAGQMREIFKHYGRIARLRENDRIRDLQKRVLGGKDSRAREELEEILDRRAERVGIEEEDREEWARAELKRLSEKR